MAHLILYDGVCGLCNRSVKVILKADPSERFLFASIQSEFGRRMLARYVQTSDVLESLILIVDYGGPSERILRKSEALLFTAGQLAGGWQYFRIAGVMPRSILDRLYDMVARNRFRWFGKLESCPLPDYRHRKRFIDECSESD